MRKVLVTLGALLTLTTALAAWNIVGVHWPVHQALSADSRNSVVSVAVYRQYALSPTTIVFDVYALDGEAAMTDVTRALFQSAKALSDKRFDKVVLATGGRHKFYLPGDYFQELGISFGIENPMYQLRTLPQNVRNLDGTPAYGTWTGGVLGVLGKQMEDLNSLRDDWLLEGGDIGKTRGLPR